MNGKNLGENKTTYIGGQAVIEGVMMRGKKMYAMAVRGPEKKIVIVKKEFTPITEKYKFLKIPILRGIVAFGGSLVLGMKIITKSAEIAMEDDEGIEPSKFEKWLEKIAGDKLDDYILYFSVFIAIIFAMGLFMFLPTFLASLADDFVGDSAWVLSVLEGTIRIIILVGYMYLISFSKDIQRVFQYHGAEHKTINCFENGEELTVDNVLKHTRLHKRCGTSFLLIVMIISIFVFFFVHTDVVWLRFAYRVILIPVIAGISYEVIRWAGRSDSVIVNIISWPGLCLQKITTKEPDESQVEVAIAAMKEVLDYEGQDGQCITNVRNREEST